MLFYIRIELDRSNVDGRSFQALTDKMLCFQGLYGFYRKHPVSLNFLKTIENTGQTGFLRISDDSSQIVVTVISLSADNCGDYKVYGSQTTAGTEREQQQALFVAKFHDIYENSYVRQYPNLHSGEQQKNICRPVPQRRLKLS